MCTSATKVDRPDLATAEPREAFARLFDEHAGPLRGYLAGRVGASAADDVLAETFLVALRKRASYDPDRAGVRSWLYGIATNLAHNHVRQELRLLRLTARLDVDRSTDGPEDAVARRVDAQVVLANLLIGVAEQDRDILLLTAWACLTPTEIGAALDLPSGTVRSRLHRLRSRLQATLDKKDDR